MPTELSEFGNVAETSAQRRTRLREELAHDIVSAAHLRGDFVMSSGEHSDYYFDKYLFLTKPTILRRLTDQLSTRIPGTVDRLVGAEGGGASLATALSLTTGLPFVITRTDSTRTDSPRTDSTRTDSTRPEKRERRRTVLGELHAGERVLVLTDVVDSGSQALATVAQVTEAGASVAGVLSVIDRGAGGPEALAAGGHHYDPLFTVADLDL